MSSSGSCLGQRLRDWLRDCTGMCTWKRQSRAGSTESHFGDGQIATGFGSTARFVVAGRFLQAKTDGAQGGLLATAMRNQSSCPRLEPRRSWSLHPGPHDLPEHLLCQAGRDGPKPSTGYRWREKTPLFTEPSSPSCAQLSPHSPQLCPPDCLETSKPPCPGGLTLTDTARMAKPVPEAHTALKCLCVPSQQHHRVTPSQVGGGPPWDRNVQD